MEIKINQHESYKIDIPSVVDKVTFFGLLDKLNSISKILSKSDLFANAGVINEDGEKLITFEHRKYKPRIKTNRDWCNTREKVVSILKLHYSDDKKGKEKKAKEIGQDWDTIVKSFHGLKKRYNIQPKEVGLKFFPSKGMKIENVRL